MTRNLNFKARNDVVDPRVRKETKPLLRGKWECFQWKAQGQRYKGDPCCFSHDSLASGNRASSQRRKGRSTSPASHSKAKQTDGEKGDKEENSDKRSVILCRYKNCKNPSCKFWHLPVCLNYKSEKKVVFIAKNATSDMLRNTLSPTRRRKKVKRKDQLHYWRSLHKWVVYLKILILENLFYVSQECCDQNTPSDSPKAPGTKLKFGKERVHREVLSKSAHLMSLRAKSRGQIT